jgi:glycosyltransferase involved in cell wall biosynthesis
VRDQFLLYPAQTWPNKNHLGLLDAIAEVRDDYGIEVPVVCCGRRTEFFRAIGRRVRELRLEHLVRFPGFVKPVELGALYRLARGLIFPSLFEGWGLPLTEAFATGTPVVCSDLPVLREQAGDSALFFSPEDSGEMARAIARVWVDEPLRQRLADRGRQNVARRTWRTTAVVMRAHYRRIGGVALAADDRELLAQGVSKEGEMKQWDRQLHISRSLGDDVVRRFPELGI